MRVQTLLVEGLDGSGKTTLLENVGNNLKSIGYQIYLHNLANPFLYNKTSFTEEHYKSFKEALKINDPFSRMSRIIELNRISLKKGIEFAFYNDFDLALIDRSIISTYVYNSDLDAKALEYGIKSDRFKSYLNKVDDYFLSIITDDDRKSLVFLEITKEEREKRIKNREKQIYEEERYFDNITLVNHDLYSYLYNHAIEILGFEVKRLNSEGISCDLISESVTTYLLSKIYN